MEERLISLPALTSKLMNKNFDRLFDQNMLQLEEDTKLERRHIIHIYTTYIA